MIKDLYNKLPSANNEDLIWKIDNNELYKKYTQTFIETDNKSIVNKKVNNVPIVIPIKFVNKSNEILDKIPDKIPDKKDRNKASNIIKPLDLILKETSTFEDFRDGVKKKLIVFITSVEFNKVFGMTKSSEIMSGIVNNRWNKSIALFISFLFDKSINYNNNIITYNKDKCKEVIQTMT